MDKDHYLSKFSQVPDHLVQHVPGYLIQDYGIIFLRQGVCLADRRGRVVGLARTPGERVSRKGTWVQIPPSPLENVCKVQTFLHLQSILTG